MNSGYMQGTTEHICTQLTKNILSEKVGDKYDLKAMVV